MRILNLTHSLSGGGAERQLNLLTSVLASMGHEVHIGYCKEGPQKSKLDGVKLHRFKALGNYDPYLFWQLIQLIQHVKPDIIQTWIVQMDILGGMAAKLCRIPWILREPSSSMAYFSWKHYLRVKIVETGAKAIVSNSLGGDNYWKAQLPNSSRYIIPNALPIADINEAAETLSPYLTETEVPIILYVGRMIALKNLKSLLEALFLVKQHQNIVGILCGEGSQQSDLEKLKNRLGLNGHVHFVGYLPNASVWSLMKKAAVFVSLSAYEGSPNTVMEAMACNCPLVLSDIPAHREILDESCAFFVEPTNIQETSDTIMKIINDRESARTSTSLAYQKAHRWSVTEMARKYEYVYQGILSNPFHKQT